ncbi:MAG: BF3164 family lipoprotein [Bacteroidota bacterium]
MEYFNDSELQKLVGEEIISKSDIFFSNMIEMKFKDSLLFVNDPTENFNMKVCDFRDNSIRYFAKRGDAPGEMTSQISRYSFDNNNNLFYLSDGIRYYNFSMDSLKVGIDRPLSYFNFSLKNDDFLGSTTFINGNIVGGMVNNRFGIYNVKNKSSKGKYKYKSHSGPLSGQSLFYSHPTKNLVFFMQVKSEVLGFLEVDTDNITIQNEYSWWISEDKDVVEGKQRSVTPDSNAKIGFVTADVSEDYVYILYSGKKVSSVKSQEDINGLFMSKYIYVLDWSGNPIKKFELDQEVKSIAINADENILYAASFENGNPHLVKFKI